MKAFDVLLETVSKLRAPNGCAWDRAQDHKSLRKHLLEESYEVLELLDHSDHQDLPWQGNLKEELGDLLLQVLLHARMAEEKNYFSMSDVVTELTDKLIRRHPHVFGGKSAASPEEARQNWETQKSLEQKDRKVLDGIPLDLPALQKAQKVVEKASKVGFQWNTLAGPWNKLEEEIAELRAELDQVGEQNELSRSSFAKLSSKEKEKLEHEFGDVLFSLVNIAHFSQINAEDALRTMLNRFSRRFQHVEARVAESAKPWDAHTLEELDVFWKEAKTKD